MKKIIFKNFLRETTIFFLLSCSSVALIVWVIQAVNYLGFVTEDGHGFKIYFLYLKFFFLGSCQRSHLHRLHKPSYFKDLLSQNKHLEFEDVGNIYYKITI